MHRQEDTITFTDLIVLSDGQVLLRFLIMGTRERLHLYQRPAIACASSVTSASSTRSPSNTSTTIANKEHGDTLGAVRDAQDEEALFESPIFQQHERSLTIQLFFDLFFVANLTAFTQRHSINSLDRLASYIGFFAILWLTWCQVVRFDLWNSL